MANPTDPNDPDYLAQGDRFRFENGRWTDSGPKKAGWSPNVNDPNDLHFGAREDLEFRDGAWHNKPGAGQGGTVNATNVGTADPSTGLADTAAWLGKGFDDAAGFLGYAPKTVDPNAPGGQLDTSQTDDDRTRLAQVLAKLQQQASEGGGAWEGTLADATQKAGSSAMALGQSLGGQGGYGNQLRNIGNAQGAVEQRAVGQGNILRAQSKIDAQDQLTGILGQQGDADASQAGAKAGAQQGVTELNNTLSGAANSQTTKDSTSLGGILGMFSDGGEVPGKANVFGDDERNDTVRAKLSPGEIVIPRSHASSPEDAASFVRALQRRGPVQHFDQGGQVGDGTGLSGTDPNSAETARAREAGAVSIFLPHIGAGMRQTKQQAPSIENGALLDTAQYDKNRGAQLQNADLIQQRAMGAGPSVAPQMMQNATDDNIAAAMQAGSRIGAGDVIQKSAAATQGDAGQAADTAAGEQARGQAGFARALAAQRNRDAALAVAKQQAAFRQTQMNAGLGLEQQAAMRNLIGGAGQAAMAGVNAAGGKGGGLESVEKSSSYDKATEAADTAFDEADWSGGVVGEDTRGEDFVRALKRRKSA